MKQDKETRNKLLHSARAEFLEKGYMKASLRTICKNAGVTTGALYFFFKDKEDLFEALVKETIDGIYRVMQMHFKDESNMLGSGMLLTPETEDADMHSEDAWLVIHQMYLHRDDVLLVLTKSQGTKYENIADQFIETAEQHYRVMAKEMQAAYPGSAVDDKFLHWLSHEMIDAFIYMITHIENEKDAVKFMSHSITYMLAGWYGLFMNKPQGDRPVQTVCE